MSKRHGFFHELRRRHVVRVAVAYAVVAWVLLQLASIVFPTFGAPDWALKVFIAVLVLGFPIALILAWAFELTPEGVRRTEPAHSEAARPDEQTHRVGRQLDIAIAAVLAVVVLLLADRFFIRRAPPEGVAAPAKSIAVLPFENLSKDENNAYFVGGMQDEILTKLAGIRDLKVISRTSTNQYASHPPDLKVVAAQLGVVSVLEGSVQRVADAVHISVRLIDAHTDNQLWAQSYNRELKDIFAVEGEVAQNIADALQAHLSPQESARVAAASTGNSAAYDLYLRGLSYYNRAYDQSALTAGEMPQAISLFEQALAADPQFAVVDALLSRSHMHMYFFAPDRSEARLAAAKAAADRALALQPDLGEGHVALALYHYWGHRDYAEAGRQLQLARQFLPNSAEVEFTIAFVARRQMHFKEAIAGFQKAIVFDPRNALIHAELGRTYANMRRYAEADREYGLAAAIAPDDVDARLSQARNLLLWTGDLAPMRKASETLPPGSVPYRGNVVFYHSLRWLARDYAAVIEIATSNTAAEWSDNNNVVLPRTLYLAWAYQAAGNDAVARQTYESVQKTVQASLSQQPDSADLHLALGFADAGLGLKDDALREGRHAAELLPASRDVISGPSILVWLAQLEVRVGDHVAAFDHLRQALALPSGNVVSSRLLQVDPVWDPVRNDPRFAQLLILGEKPVEIETKP